MAAKKTAEGTAGAGAETKPDGEGKAPGQQEGQPGGEPKSERVAVAVAELKSCEKRMTSEEMFGRFMLAVATRNMTAGDIAETAERLTTMWEERKDKFAGK